MPYTHPLARPDIDPQIDTVIDGLRDRRPAVLNYALSRIAGAYVAEAYAQRLERSALMEVAHEQPELLANEENRRRVIANAREDAGATIPDYETRAEVWGTINSFAREFQRRVVDEYEERKIMEGAADVPEYARLDPPPLLF